MCAVYTAVKPSSILKTAAGAGTLGLFLDAVRAAGLEERLSRRGSLTVFMPTDNAMSDLGGAALEALFADPQKLRRFVAHHIVPGKYVGSYFSTRVKLRTLAGTELAIDRSTFLQPDIECSNGLIHVTDSALLPPPA